MFVAIWGRHFRTDPIIFQIKVWFDMLCEMVLFGCWYWQIYLYWPAWHCMITYFFILIHVPWDVNLTLTTDCLIQLHFSYRGSYTSGHFIWNLSNDRCASFINFIWNDHECKILFIIWPFEMRFYRLQIEHYLNKKRIVDTDVVSDVASSRQSVITRVAICFLWHDFIYWITATSNDKKIHAIGENKQAKTKTKQQQKIIRKMMILIKL